MMPKPTAAAPVRVLTLVERAAPVCEGVEADAVLELEGVVDVAVAAVPELVRVTPTASQRACEYCSAAARSEASHALWIQAVVLLTNCAFLQRQALSCWLQLP